MIIVEQPCTRMRKINKTRTEVATLNMLSIVNFVFTYMSQGSLKCR